MKRKKIVWYDDELNDDFAGNNIKTKHIPPDYEFVHKGLRWRLRAWFLYYVIAFPIVCFISKVYLGLKIENRKALRKIKGGFFLYGNHTRELDAFLPAVVAFPKKAYIIANPDAVSIPFLKTVVEMLGAVPIPDDFETMHRFVEAITERCREGNAIAIFPEAHIWPFYTGIRNFSDTSFRYPAHENAPVVAMVTTYRKRLFFRRPAMTLTISEPMYPDMSLPLPQRKKDLRDRTYSFMLKTSSEKENIPYIIYKKRVS